MLGPDCATIVRERSYATILMVGPSSGGFGLFLMFVLQDFEVSEKQVFDACARAYLF